MTTRVPFVPPQPPTTAVMGGRPVSSSTWTNASEQVNYLLGHGAQIIPATHMHVAISAGASKDLRFKVVMPYAATTLLWVVALRSSHATASSTVAISTPTGGTAVSYGVGAARGSAPIRHIEQRTSKVGTATEISIRIAPTVQGVYVESVSCFAMPRLSLALDSTDYGVDSASQMPRQPIYSASFGTGLGLSVLAGTAATCLTRARRCGLMHMPIPDNSTDAFAVTGATNLYGDSTPIGCAPALARKLYGSSTTGTLTAEVLAWQSGAGGTTYGVCNATTVSGATLTVNLGTAGSRLTTTPTWYSGTVAVDCEDLTASDGRRSTRWDDTLWTANRTAGADTIYIATISGYEA